MTDVLIIDDDAQTVRILTDYLKMHDVSVESDDDAGAGLSRLLGGSYRMVVFSREIRGVDYARFLAMIRESLEIPVLVLTSSPKEADVIRTLEEGADVVMRKPLMPGETVAQIRALLRMAKRTRRTDIVTTTVLESRGIRLDSATRRVKVRGRERKFTKKEYELLYFFMSHPDEVFTREQIYREIWGMDTASSVATVTVHIKKLRQLIEEKPARPTILTTDWSQGYRFCSEVVS